MTFDKEKTTNILKLCTDFRDKYEITCEEDIYQRDVILEELPELFTKIIKQIGYLNEK